MIFTYQNYVKTIKHELAQGPRKVWVSSFGLNAGISDICKIYTASESFKLLQLVAKNTSGSRILVGCPTRPDKSFFRRLTNTAEYFPTISMRTHRECHLKCWVFFHVDGKTTSVFGGRNVGDSEWADASVWLKNGDARQLSAFYDHLWLDGKEVLRTKKLLIR